MLTCGRKMISMNDLVAIVCLAAVRAKNVPAAECVRSRHFGGTSSSILQSNMTSLQSVRLLHRLAHTELTVASCNMQACSSASLRPVVMPFPSFFHHFFLVSSITLAVGTFNRTHFGSRQSLTILSVFRSSKGGEVIDGSLVVVSLTLRVIPAGTPKFVPAKTRNPNPTVSVTCADDCCLRI